MIILHTGILIPSISLSSLVDAAILSDGDVMLASINLISSDVNSKIQIPVRLRTLRSIAKIK